MVRVLFYAILLFLLLRTLSRVWNDVKAGMQGGSVGPRSHVPERGVHMVRDPICGTFVVPGRSVALAHGRETLHFCSTTCRDRYSADTTGRRRADATGRSA